MKILVAYYSRTGTTKKVAGYIAGVLKCDIEELIDLKKRTGILGIIKSSFDAKLKKLTDLGPLKFNPAKYDVVIIGSPVWAQTLVPAVRTYIQQNKDSFKNTSLFCVSSGSGEKATLKHMSGLCGSKPLFTFMTQKKFIKTLEYQLKAKEFAEDIRHCGK